MGEKFNLLVLMSMTLILMSCGQGETNTLKSAFKGKFYMGVALNKDQYMGKDELAQEVVKEHFNSIVAENCMKSMYLQPREGEFYFDDADQFVAFGEANNMHIVGHTLIWHSQAPRWFFTDTDGKEVTREVLLERMKNHIYGVVGHYKGKIKGWDVVNEAIEDNGNWRNSKFYQIIGEDFIKYAFQFAHEADPDAELYYNDYSMYLSGRRNTVIQMVKSLQEQNIRIDGIGMQGHIGMDYPTLEDFETSIKAFSDLGVKVMITELDLSALPNPRWVRGANLTDRSEYAEQINPYKEGLPTDVETEWEDRYVDFFKLFLKYADVIDRVTVWGVSDAGSWKNNFPVHGRTDYPLFFDRTYQAKNIVQRLIEEAKR